MKKKIQFTLLTIFLSLYGIFPCNALDIPGVKGDGVHDDTQGLQALLDSRASTVYFPKPDKCYLISKTLKIHSGQTLIVDRNAVIRLADHAEVHLLTNSDHQGGNNRITVIGGIWDGNNLTQTTAYHIDRKNKDLPYDPDRYIGVLMVFDNVKDLHISDVTFKDPEMFALLGGNLFQFTMENITFDFNMKRGNMDGLHIFGPSSHGRITNIKGATNDDLVALNADDVPLVEPSRGPITDIQIDGLWSENGYRAVRINSCGSTVKRIKISNIFGTYQFEAIILSNHNVHPGCVSEFEDISVSGLFCSNATKNVKLPHIRVYAPAVVTNLNISDYNRTESAYATDNIVIEKGATINHLSISNTSLINQCNANINLVNNQGTIEVLHLSNIIMQSKEPGQVQLLQNTGDIKVLNKTNISINGKVE